MVPYGIIFCTFRILNNSGALKTIMPEFKISSVIRTLWWDDPVLGLFSRLKITHLLLISDLKQVDNGPATKKQGIF